RVTPPTDPLLRKEGEFGDLTFFELCTLISFLYFAEKKVDVAVLETGLGGQLDATNVVKPWVSVITEISLDHTEILGTDLAAIASEKAGIVKPKVPVVCGATAEEAVSVIRRVAKEKEAPFFSLSSLPDLTLGLSGAHQRHNAAIAWATVQVLRQDAGLHRLSPLTRPISDSAVRRGLEKVHWPGRLEWVSLKPPILLDGAHNPEGIRALVDYLKQLPPLLTKEGVGGRAFSRALELDLSPTLPFVRGGRTHWKILFSASKDKDVEGMLNILKDVSDEIT